MVTEIREGGEVVVVVTGRGLGGVVISGGGGKDGESSSLTLIHLQPPNDRCRFPI